MLKVWITAGGTGSAWHICSVIKKYYKDEVELFVGDINDEQLVASSTLADHFFKVPLVKDEAYPEFMYDKLSSNGIDVIIPLIPWEQDFFSMDNPRFASLGIKSLAAPIATNQIFNDKIKLHDYCSDKGIPTIKIFNKDEINPADTYFIKALSGFGAAGAAMRKGEELTEKELDSCVIQEYCVEPQGLNEITVEVFNDDGKLFLCGRRRLENKCGVCTKAEFVETTDVRPYIEQMVGDYEFPLVFNVQFVHHDGVWKVMDVNLRLAAGTGLSNAVGFQLIRALFNKLLGKEFDETLLSVDSTVKTVIRVYEEVVIR